MHPYCCQCSPIYSINPFRSARKLLQVQLLKFDDVKCFLRFLRTEGKGSVLRTVGAGPLHASCRVQWGLVTDVSQ